MIDITSLLDEHSVEFKTSGKNVGGGWVEVNCPFCYDPSFHLGINLKNGLFHCWVCGSKGHLSKLLTEILQINYYQAEELIKEYDSDELAKEEEKPPNPKIEFPEGYTNILPDLHKQYLIKRNFDPDFLQRKYSIGAVYQTGRFSYRVIIPIFLNKQIVNFTGRDVSGLQKTKYLHYHNDEAIKPMKHCVYNLDSVRDKAIIVEGVFDAWRIGDGGVALLGVEYTTQQLNLLLEKEIKEVYILFDNDPTGINKAEKLGNVLSTFIPKIEILTLKDEIKDPAELTPEEVIEIKEEINFL